MNVPSCRPSDDLPCPIHHVVTPWHISSYRPRDLKDGEPGFMDVGFFDCGLLLTARWTADMEAEYAALPRPRGGPREIALTIISAWLTHNPSVRRSRKKTKTGVQWGWFEDGHEGAGWYFVEPLIDKTTSQLPSVDGYLRLMNATMPDRARQRQAAAGG